MSKILEASCVGGIVTADSLPVPTAEILSEGVGSSEGILVMDQDKQWYISKASGDLKTTLETISSILQSLVTGLTLIDAKVMVTSCPAGAGTAGPTPVAVSSIAELSVAKAQIDLLKEMLK